MKRIIFHFSVLLLLAPAFTCTRVKTVIDTPLIKSIDGTTFMDAASFKACYETWELIHHLQYTPNKFNFVLNNQQISLKDLVIFEHSLNKNSVPATDERQKNLKKLLHEVVDYFKAQTAEHKKSVESSAAKDTNRKIVQFWLEKQGTQISAQSLLSKWGTPEEDIALYHASAHELFRFFNDLKHFLEDFMLSCPKARKQFESYLTPEARQGFEKFFTN